MPIPKPSKGESKNSYMQKCMSDSGMNKEYDQSQRAAICISTWKRKKSKASMLVELPMENDETIFGDDIELSDAEYEEIKEAIAADNKEPYGDVPYADPGYQSDKKKRYPLDTESHIRSAHNYFSQERNSSKYSPEQRAKIKARIAARWRKVIDSKGPPSEQK